MGSFDAFKEALMNNIYSFITRISETRGGTVTLIYIGLFLILMVFFKVGFTYLTNYNIIFLRNSVIHDIRNEFFNKTVSLPNDPEEPGDHPGSCNHYGCYELATYPLCICIIPGGGNNHRPHRQVTQETFFGGNLKISDLRALMGIVNQDSILFNDTFFNNIAFGVDQATEEGVINAACVAHAHEFIEAVEGGYYATIGDRGSKLSGGQRQRLSIARAVLKNPPILILDEATSALDTESEKLVQDALTKLMENRTSIVIAHRLSTIVHADEIFVLQNGHIVERGNHEELLALKGKYHKFYSMQYFS